MLTIAPAQNPPQRLPSRFITCTQYTPRPSPEVTLPGYPLLNPATRYLTLTFVNTRHNNQNKLGARQRSAPPTASPTRPS